jgi:hypothetical protein
MFGRKDVHQYQLQRLFAPWLLGHHDEGGCVMKAYAYFRVVGKQLGFGLALFLFSMCFAFSASAQGSGGVLQALCSSSLSNLMTLDFSPGLLLLDVQPTQITSPGFSVSCTTPSDLSATVTNLQGSGNLSCLINTQTSGSMLWNWSDGTQSEVTWNSIQVGPLDVPAVQRVFVLTGTVQSGKFEGDTMVISYNDIPNLNYLDCLTSGLTGITGLGTATFTTVPPL